MQILKEIFDWFQGLTQYGSQAATLIDPAYCQLLRILEETTSREIDAVLEEQTALIEPHVARILSRSLPVGRSLLLFGIFFLSLANFELRF